MMIISSTPSMTGKQKGLGARSIVSTLTHPLTADNISQPTKEELSDEGTNRGSNLDAEILIGGEFSTWVNDEQPGRGAWGM
jgi:hypothetical protein